LKHHPRNRNGIYNRQNNIIGDIPFVLGGYLLWYTGKIRDMVKENADKILKCHTPF